MGGEQKIPYSTLASRHASMERIVQIAASVPSGDPACRICAFTTIRNAKENRISTSRKRAILCCTAQELLAHCEKATAAGLAGRQSTKPTD